MERNGLTEEQAHRFLQKRSMDNGRKLIDTAIAILEGW
jgi:response regulator NasT